jgi:hypothetical protein
MNNGMREILQRGAFVLTLLLPATMFPPRVAAQSQRPGPLAGAPPSGQGKPGRIPPQGGLVQGVAPEGMSPAAVHPVPVGTSIPVKKTPAGEEFFIVASVDLQKSQLLLKYPTEVTLLMRVDDSTKFADESGEPLKLSDFRAGDTVWVTSTNNKSDVTAVRVRKGRMDVADLHRYYLNYSEIR